MDETFRIRLLETDSDNRKPETCTAFGKLRPGGKLARVAVLYDPAAPGTSREVKKTSRSRRVRWG